jgi:hypothetical protein
MFEDTTCQVAYSLSSDVVVFVVVVVVVAIFRQLSNLSNYYTVFSM